MKPGLSMDHLPASVRELVDVVGMDAALAIVEARGGIRFYVPATASPEHWLVGVIGLLALEKLVAYYQGDEIEVPRCTTALRIARELQIVTEHDEGDSNAALARRYGYTERGIRKLRRRVEAEQERDERQGGLF